MARLIIEIGSEEKSLRYIDQTLSLCDFTCLSKRWPPAVNDVDRRVDPTELFERRTVFYLRLHVPSVTLTINFANHPRVCGALETENSIVQQKFIFPKMLFRTTQYRVHQMNSVMSYILLRKAPVLTGAPPPPNP